jgi:hypothetical protein
MESTTVSDSPRQPAPDDAPVRPPDRPRWFRWLWSPVKLVLGTFLMQSPAGAVVVAGWLQRYLQRAVYRSWWRRSRGRLGTFDEFVAEEPVLLGFQRFPNWVMGLTSPIWTGIQTLANVGALTLPGMMLWAVGWWGGWQNSFHKGYEQFLIGPWVSWLGILLFMVAMLYVPMAVARQAATGQWKSFWEGRTVWRLIQASGWQSAWVAVLYAVANAVVMAMKSWPQFLPQFKISELAKRGLDPTEALEKGIETVDWAQLTDAQALFVLDRYYLGTALLVLVILLGLKRLLAWMYSGAVIRAIQRGTLGEDSLADTEWRWLNTLGLLQEREAPVRPVLVRIVAWAGRTVGRVLSRTIVFLAWFGFVGTIYISEFLSYHPIVGWLNQPLVQLPWFRYVPAGLESPAPSLGFAAAMVLVACLSVRIRRWALGRRGLDGKR